MNFRIVAVGGVIAVVLGGAMVFRLESLNWRVAVAMRYLHGEIPGVSPIEFFGMLRPGSGYWLEPLLEGRGLSAVVENPYNTAQDAATGRDIFRARCGSCHGADAGGGSAPSLRKTTLKHGNADWVLYRNILDGIPGTAMVPNDLTKKKAWQVVSFIRSLQAQTKQVLALNAAASGNVLSSFKGVTYGDLLEAEGDSNEWRMYSRTYSGWRFSPLSQINIENVNKLRLFWARQLNTPETVVEATPIVIDGVMFITEPPNSVLAIDARNGDVFWSYRREITEKLSLCCGRVNRGVAVLGDRVYFGTLDAHLVALEAKNGNVVWDIELAKPKEGYSITGAPLAVKDMVVTGVSGGEFGIRGFVHAVDARTGQTRWRFYTIPGSGEPGHESWAGDSWKFGGGPTWITGSYAPDLNLILWGVGNPSPVYQGDVRKGDNLYTNSVVAINADSGRLAWYFQFTPHDEHDWDSNQIPVLVDISRAGGTLPAVAWANRNGFYYVLDRGNGRFLTGRSFVRQNWAERLDDNGRPVSIPAASVSPRGTLTYPGVAGGTNWQSPAYYPELGLFFVHALEGSSIFTKIDLEEIERRPFELFVGSGSSSQKKQTSYVRALKADTGERIWEYRSNSRPGIRSGLLATGGGLVFGGANERLFALEAATGRELWSVVTGGEMHMAPISFGIEGQQVIAVIAGRAIMTFAL